MHPHPDSLTQVDERALLVVDADDHGDLAELASDQDVVKVLREEWRLVAVGVLHDGYEERRAEHQVPRLRRLFMRNRSMSFYRTKSCGFINRRHASIPLGGEGG